MFLVVALITALPSPTASARATTEFAFVTDSTRRAFGYGNEAVGGSRYNTDCRGGKTRVTCRHQ